MFLSKEQAKKRLKRLSHKIDFDSEKGCHLYPSKTKEPSTLINGKYWGLSRLSALVKFGDRLHLKGIIVRHICDTPNCVNPDHLMLGTHQENSDDKIKRGRQVCLNRKLSDCDYAEIAEMFKAGYNCQQIANKYNMARHSISAIKNGRVGRHVTGFEKVERQEFKKLESEIVLKVLELLEQGYLHKEIKQMLGISKTVISDIRTGKKYSSVTGIKYKQQNSNNPNKSDENKQLSLF